MTTNHADPTWLAWRARLQTLCSEMRMEASRMDGAPGADGLFEAAWYIGFGAYYIDAAILKVATEEEA